MTRRSGPVILASIAALALAIAVPASAQLPSGFQSKDIGSPGMAGSTAVDNKGVYTIKGGGHDIWDSADDFQFVYTTVKGDGSVTARVLSQDGGSTEWSKVGPMIRESDAAGSKNVMLEMTTGHGVVWQWRDTPDEASDYPQYGDWDPRHYPAYLRVQRIGNDFSSFVSDDGKLWRSSHVVKPNPMAETALFGVAVTSHDDGDITTATFDTVAVQPGIVSVPTLTGCGGDKAVLLSWPPVPNATGYNIYRGPAGAKPDQLVKVNTDPVTGGSFAVNDLANGTAQVFAVAPVLKVGDGTPTDGPMVTLTATPTALPAGLTSCSINENTNPGSASFDAGTGEITLRGSGGDTWQRADRMQFANVAMDGDVQITVKALTKPTATNDSARAGLMIRDSLEGSGRDACLGVTAAAGLQFLWRSAALANAEWGGSAAIEDDTLQIPITLRLTRKGNVITPQYSTDDGKTFQSAGDAYTFADALPKTVYVGLFITSHDATKIGEAKFSNVDIKKL